MALKTGVVSFRVSISGGSSEGLKRFAETYPVFPLHLNIILNLKKKLDLKIIYYFLVLFLTSF